MRHIHFNIVCDSADGKDVNLTEQTQWQTPV